MKEEILKIIEENIWLCKNGCGDPLLRNTIETSKEITSHVFKFIQWLKDECDVVFDPRQGLYFWKNNDKGGEYLTSEEAYQYWKDNVKDKHNG